jgi:hypothetical protein
MFQGAAHKKTVALQHYFLWFGMWTRVWSEARAAHADKKVYPPGGTHGWAASKNQAQLYLLTKNKGFHYLTPFTSNIWLKTGAILIKMCYNKIRGENYEKISYQ